MVGKSKALWESQRAYHSKPTLPVPSLNTKDAAPKYTPSCKTQEIKYKIVPKKNKKMKINL
jgi:hypothetical protein